TAPYTWTINGNPGGPNFTNLTAGNYNIQVTDDNGCVDNAVVNVGQPAAALDLTVTMVDDVNCFGGNDGSINTNTVGGTAPYAWTINGNPGGPNFTNLTAGNYNIQVTDDNGCVDNAVVNVGQPAAALDLTVAMVDDVNCFGGNDGSISTNTTGGTAPYTWTINGNPGGPNFTNLTAGNYNIQVTDDNGCVDNAVVNVGQPAAALSASGIVVNPLCNGQNNGSIDLNVVGGTSPYQYAWNNGSIDEDIHQLSAGNYAVVITDAQSCQTTINFTVMQPDPLALDATVKNILCHGLMNGYIDLQVTGGVTPYQYFWNTGANSQDLTQIGAGTYTVTVLDDNQCMIQATYVLQDVAPIEIQTEEEYTIFVGEEVVLNANVSGGAGGYTYLWSPADWLDCNTCLNPTASPLLTTEYVLMVADQNGCTQVASSTVNVLYTLYVPNTFSPNGDGINDKFTAVSRSCKEFRMYIFNRWGDKVYETDNIHHGWDGYYLGKEAKQDVYSYRIEAKFYNGQYQELIGQVNLLR
ncbi:MAG: gliding motility-associated C-terminal domain-containing protein, partial [Flavobacteriales bacterium]|nr:gliding motility-associated C-terminal domain-containing protein [Flavobacteriales bacterium]